MSREAGGVVVWQGKLRRSGSGEEHPTDLIRVVAIGKGNGTKRIVEIAFLWDALGEPVWIPVGDKDLEKRLEPDPATGYVEFNTETLLDVIETLAFYKGAA